MRKVFGRLVAVNPDVTMVLSSRLQAMTEGEIRTRVQHARVGAAFTKAIARRMSTCMTPNYLAALGPGGEQTPSHDAQNQPERRGASAKIAQVPYKWASKATFTSSR